jgi:hypothetical protein
VELTFLRRVLRLNLVLGALVCAASLLFRRADVALGTALGAALSAANFYAIRRVTARVLASANPRKQFMLMSLLVVKMAALIGLVYIVIRYTPVHVVAFVVGLSTFLLSIILTTFFAGSGDNGPEPRTPRRRRRRRRPLPAGEPELAPAPTTLES